MKCFFERGERRGGGDITNIAVLSSEERKKRRICNRLAGIATPLKRGEERAGRLDEEEPLASVPPTLKPRSK